MSGPIKGRKYNAFTRRLLVVLFVVVFMATPFLVVWVTRDTIVECPESHDIPIYVLYRSDLDLEKTPVQVAKFDTDDPRYNRQACEQTRVLYAQHSAQRSLTYRCRITTE